MKNVGVYAAAAVLAAALAAKIMCPNALAGYPEKLNRALSGDMDYTQLFRTLGSDISEREAELVSALEDNVMRQVFKNG